jgi:hypothetical protein
LSKRNALGFQSNFLLRTVEHRPPNPSKISALDFKREFRRFGTGAGFSDYRHQLVDSSNFACKGVIAPPGEKYRQGDGGSTAGWLFHTGYVTFWL